MARYEIAPTKTNLLKLRQELRFSQEGYELLDQKRNILIVELMGIIDTAKAIQKEVDEAFQNAFESLSNSVKSIGRRNIKMLSRAIKIETNIVISKRKVMGVSLPVVRVDTVDNSPYFSLIDNSFWIDDSVKNFKDVLKILGNLAEVRVSLMRLAFEVKKTIRKVNALEKIAIPDYHATIKDIE
ncbi:MAG: V-type ATP synthase subunit D, partial [Spirochaetes bacterium]|nr:V-type ATP synthase subunit D [Spirochaetota bacterium]